MDRLSERARSLRSSRIRELLHLTERPDMLSLAGGLPAPATFPAAAIAAAMDGVLSHQGATGPIALQYGPTEGVRALRELLADEHGVGIEQVLVTTGSQQGLDLAGRALCDPGDVIVVESPTYLGAIQAFLAGAVRLVGCPGDADGLDTDVLAGMLGDGLRPRAVYVVPNFHNPTGATLGAGRREHLTTLADRYGFVVIEDDPYAALRFRGTALPSLADTASSGAANVLQLRSSSKIVAPGLRVGWAIGPREVVEAMVRLKQAVDLHTPSLNQLIVAALLTDRAAFEAHLARSRRHYAERAASLVHALGEQFGDRLHVSEPDGGMFAWATFLDGTDTEQLLATAVDEGVAFVPGTAFSLDGEGFRSSMRLSFATLDPATLVEATARLARAAARPARSVAAARG